MTNLRLAVFVVLVSHSCCLAQMRRDVETRPQLRPHSLVPTAPIRCLQFSREQDGLFLYAAGDGKVVYRFHLPEQDSGRATLIPGEPTYWPISRDATGTISAMALLRDTKGMTDRMAFGGIGVVTPEVFLADAKGRQVSKLLLNPVPASLSRKTGVMAIDYDARRELLLVGHSGSGGGQQSDVTLWKLTPPQRLLRSLPTPHNDVQCLRISPRGDYVATADFNDASGLVQFWRLEEFSDDRNGPTMAPISQVHFHRQIYSLEWLDENRIVAGTRNDGRVLQSLKDGEPTPLRFDVRYPVRLKNSSTQPVSVRYVENPSVEKVTPEQAKRLFDGSKSESLAQDAKTSFQNTGSLVVEFQNPKNPKQSFPVNMTPGSSWEFAGFNSQPPVILTQFMSVNHVVRIPNSELCAAAVGQHGAISGGDVRLLSMSHDLQRPLENAGFESDSVVLAVSPDGTLLAGAGLARRDQSHTGVCYQIRIWSVENGRLLAQIPDGKSVLGGGPIASAEIIKSEGTDSFAIGFSYGPYVARGAFRDPERQLALTKEHWRVSKIPTDSEHKTNPTLRSSNDIAFGNDGFFLGRDRLGPFPHMISSPRCFVRFPLGNLDVVAIGYATGILVWDVKAALDPLKRGRAILRSFFGNEGRISCLSVSKDARRLISGSDDGTICAWSLEGIEPSRRNELGAKLIKKGNRIVVGDPVEPYSPAWNAGLQEGQEIKSITVSTRQLAREHWLDLASHLVPGEEHVLHAESSESNDSNPLVTTVSQDYLWTFYPQFDGNWVIWTPQGFVDASPGGREAMYWHVNPPRATLLKDPGEKTAFSMEEPRVLLSSYFWDTFNKPHEIRRLLCTYDRQEIPNLAKEKGLSTDKLLPSLDVEDVQDLPAKQSISVRFRLHRSVDMPNVKVQIWCNSCLLETWSPNDDQSGELIHTVQVPEGKLRVGGNRIVAAPFTGEEGQEQFLIYESRTFHVEGEPPRRRLHYLGVGVTELDSVHSGLDELKYCGNDVRYLGEALRALTKVPGAEFELGTFQVLRNDDAKLPAAERPTKPNVLKALERLVEKAGPDDFVCVCFSGHGLGSLPGQEQKSASGFYFIAQDTSANNVRESAVTRQLLYEHLNQVPCPTLLLIDACRSGSVALDQKLLNVGGLQFGPLVLVSCRANETSKEFPSLPTVPGSQQGHGVFTAAIISSLASTGIRTGQLASGLVEAEPSISVGQLCANVERHVPRLLEARRNQDQSNKGPAPLQKMSSQTPQTLLSITFPKELVLRKRHN